MKRIKKKTDTEHIKWKSKRDTNESRRKWGIKKLKKERKRQEWRR